MSLFQSGPPEILTHILSNCDDFTQLFSLINTCKHLHSIWKDNCGPVIWRLGNQNIVCFDDALIAARATTIVKTAEQTHQLPPSPFPITSLSGEIQKPTQKEFTQVLALRHLANCIQNTIIEGTVNSHSGFQYDLCDGEYDLNDDGSLERYGEDGTGWQVNFHRAIYRSLIAGAASARAYLAPFRPRAVAQGEALEIPSSAPEKQWWEKQVWDMTDQERMENQLPEADLAIMRKYPVFNWDAEDESERGKERDKGYRDAFEPFAKWVVQDAKRRCRERGVLQSKAVLELYHIMAASEHLRAKIVNSEPTAVLGRRSHCNNLGVRTTFQQDYREKLVVPEVRNDITRWSGQRKASVVLNGIFQIEEISMPAKIDETNMSLLIAAPHPEVYRTGDAARPFFVDIPACLNRVVIPDWERSDYSCWQLFKYAFRKHFRCQFSRWFYSDYDPGDENPTGYESLARPIIFCTGEETEGTIITRYGHTEHSKDSGGESSESDMSGWSPGDRL